MSNRLYSLKAHARSALFDAFADKILPTAGAAAFVQILAMLGQTLRAARDSALPLNPARAMFVYVGSGATKLIASASGGREQIVAFHFAGDLVSIPANAWHSYRLAALVDTEVLAFPAEEFLRIAESEPALQGALLHRSLAALHRCRDKAVGLGRKNAQERLASFLVGMAERTGRIDGNICILDLPMSRRDIGDSLGLTIETVSRQFSELRLTGMIETSGRSRVLLRDVAGLTERAGHV